MSSPNPVLSSLLPKEIFNIVDSYIEGDEVARFLFLLEQIIIQPDDEFIIKQIKDITPIINPYLIKNIKSNSRLRDNQEQLAQQEDAMFFLVYRLVPYDVEYAAIIAALPKTDSLSQRMADLLFKYPQCYRHLPSYDLALSDNTLEKLIEFDSDFVQQSLTIEQIFTILFRGQVPEDYPSYLRYYTESRNEESLVYGTANEFGKRLIVNFPALFKNNWLLRQNISLMLEILLPHPEYIEYCRVYRESKADFLQQAVARNPRILLEPILYQTKEDSEYDYYETDVSLFSFDLLRPYLAQHPEILKQIDLRQVASQSRILLLELCMEQAFNFLTTFDEALIELVMMNDAVFKYLYQHHEYHEIQAFVESGKPSLSKQLLKAANELQHRQLNAVCETFIILLEAEIDNGEVLTCFETLTQQFFEHFNPEETRQYDLTVMLLKSSGLLLAKLPRDKWDETFVLTALMHHPGVIDLIAREAGDFLQLKAVQVIISSYAFIRAYGQYSAQTAVQNYKSIEEANDIIREITPYDEPLNLREHPRYVDLAGYQAAISQLVDEQSENKEKLSSPNCRFF